MIRFELGQKSLKAFYFFILIFANLKEEILK